MNITWKVLTTIIWLVSFSQQINGVSNETDLFSISFESDFYDKHIVNITLLQTWQDWVVSNLICVNYLNRLLIHSSREDFAFNVPDKCSIKYIQNTKSFRQTMSQLETQIKVALSGAREDLNRVYTGMDRVPNHLHTMLLYLQHANTDLLDKIFPDLFMEIEKLTNDSLDVLEKPAKSFQEVLNFLNEIEYLIMLNSSRLLITFEVNDVKAHWSNLTDLTMELFRQARKTRENFIIQLNWFLEEVIKPDLVLSQSRRSFLISLILPKIIEIDRMADILGTVTKTYSDVSFLYTDDLIGSNGHLLLLEQEEDRKRYLKELYYDLQTQVVHVTRLALKRHDQFNIRDSDRYTNIDRFIQENQNVNFAHFISTMSGKT